MKQKKYSESKIKTAQEYLSKYDLAFNSLSDSQQDSVISFSNAQKYLMIYLFICLVIIVIFIASAYFFYTRDLIVVETAFDLYKSGEAVHPYHYHFYCFIYGFLISSFLVSTFYILLFAIKRLLTLKEKRQLLDAFLPSLKQSSNDEQTPNN